MLPSRRAPLLLTAALISAANLHLLRAQDTTPTPAADNSTAASDPASLPDPKILKPRTISGSMNYISYFTDTTNDLGSSMIYQSGSNIGIGTTSPVQPSISHPLSTSAPST
ncbi:MAG: hypothetical protein JO336_11455 [Acidobacteriia bacterium]|nr:hypothetical protein [Terriglobia bacterium]MBV8905117.1 hypothetical protein [Terriglobia bacterium]MBV9745406.1 hypothetical protein [Terriglobia bacterium]